MEHQSQTFSLGRTTRRPRPEEPVPASRFQGRAGRNGGRQGGRPGGRGSAALLRALITATATSVANGLMLATPPLNRVVLAADSALLRAAGVIGTGLGSIAESSLGPRPRCTGRLAHAIWTSFSGAHDASPPGLRHAPASP